MEIAFQHHAWATRAQLESGRSLDAEHLNFNPQASMEGSPPRSGISLAQIAGTWEV